MPLRPNEIERCLLHKLKFERAKTHEAGHRWYVRYLDGLPPIRTKVSHSRDPISPGVEHAMSHQLHVRKPFFIEVVSCAKSREEYENQVRTDPYPPLGQRIV
jgi:hypothetical protein